MSAAQNISGKAASKIDAHFAKQRKLANLRQAVWEASGHMKAADIAGFVDDVLREIASDEP